MGGHKLDWLKRFPELQQVKDEAWQQVREKAKVVAISSGTILYRSGDRCENFVLVIEGSIRVQMVSETGNEVVLYRVEEGQSCILTTTCLVAHEKYHAEGISETAVTAVVIPAADFQHALAESEGFRRFVFSSYGQRLTRLFMLIEAITFGRMDIRLAAALQRLSQDSAEIHITHSDLARELGTAREVISRLLKDFERRHWLAMKRGVITILDPAALAALAGKSDAM